MIHPMTIKQNSSILQISGPKLIELIEKPQPILWHNKGLYAVVPVERVRNAISVFKDQQHCKKSGSITFHWSETVEIPKEAGQVMEKYNGGEDGKQNNSG